MKPVSPAHHRAGIGSCIAPPRFLLFLAILAITSAAMAGWRHARWDDALVWGFNLAAVFFAISLWPLRRDHTAAQMQAHAAQNNANRALVLLVTGIVMLTIMAAIAATLGPARLGDGRAIAKLILTLSLAWAFTNLVFMLHYAHAFYTVENGKKDHRGGFEFPGTAEPDYWDFLYFSFTAGMSFAASDVNVTNGHLRRVVVVQCLLSFVFNIGVIAFTINTLGGAG
jgi:uncharacterized membrane protein